MEKIKTNPLGQMKIINQIVFALAFIFLTIVCVQHDRIREFKNIKADTLRDTTYVYDTTWLTKVIIKSHIDTILDTAFIPVDVDTAAILADYFKTVVYDDTLVNDTSITFVEKLCVHKNRIANRGISYKNNRPIQVINNTTIIQQPPVFKLFLTGEVGYNNVSLGALGEYKNYLYFANYNVVTKSVNIGGGVKIFKK